MSDDSQTLVADFKRCLISMSGARASWDAYDRSSAQKAAGDRAEHQALARAREIWRENPDFQEELRGAFASVQPLATMREIEAGSMTISNAELKRLAEAARSGPWRANDGFNSSGRQFDVVQARAGRSWDDVCSMSNDYRPQNAAFIAAAREAVPALISENDGLRAALVQAREDILHFANARWSEAEGTDEDHVGYIDAALSSASDQKEA